MKHIILMKRIKRIQLFPVLLFFSVLFFSAGPLWGEFFYGDDLEIITLGHTARRLGKVLPFSSFPVHGSDILDFADYLLSCDDEAQEKRQEAEAAGQKMRPFRSSLNETERLALEDLIAQLEEQAAEDILIRGNLALAYEHRLSTAPFTIDGEEVPNAEDFRRAYLDFTPFLSFGAAAGTFNGPWVAARADIRPAWTDNYSPWSNIPPKVDISFDFLKRGVFAWNGAYVNFFLGRDTVHWGNPGGSTLYPSALLPFLDSLRLNVPLGPFSFDYLLGAIIPKKSAYRDVYDASDYKKQSLTPGSGNYTDYFGFLDDPNPSIILTAAHRFQWNFGAVKAGIGGNVVYVRSNNAFHITDFLPVMIYHNSDIYPNNLSFILDLSWTVYPGLEISAMAGFDDISARTFGIPDGDIPTIPAGLVQAEYGLAAEHFFMDLFLEAGYTHYLWGNFHFDDPPFTQGEARLAKAVYRYAPNKYAVLLPLTSPYGPGALWGKIRADFDLSRGNAAGLRPLRAGAEILFLVKNSRANLVDTPYGINEGLKSYDRWFFALDIPLSYTWKGLEFSFCPSLLWGSGGQALECTLGLRWTLEGGAYFSVPRRTRR